MSWLASQLQVPHGPASSLLAITLNRTNRDEIAQSVRMLNLSDGSIAADLGFGGGLGLRLLLDRVGDAGRVHGIDLSQEMVRRAGRRYRHHVNAGRLILHHSSINSLPLDDGSVNGAITINTVYFIAELDQAFAEMRRILSSAGVLVVGIGDPDAMAQMPMTPFGFRIRPIDEILTMATASGLTVRQHTHVATAARPYHLVALARAR